MTPYFAFYKSLKSTFSNNSVINNMGLSSFVQPLLPPKNAKQHKIPREFELIAVQGHPRSLTLVPIESTYATSCQSLVVTLVVSGTVFKILPHKARKQLVFRTSPLFDATARGNPLEFLDKTYTAKTRWIGLLCGESCKIITSTVVERFIRVTDRQTDGRQHTVCCAYVLSCSINHTYASVI